jgi:hypothetical protein
MEAKINWGGACLKTVADLSDKEVEAAIELDITMDPDLRERLHGRSDCLTPRSFLEAYCREHEARFGAPWAVP